jgi:hypothetical protein
MMNDETGVAREMPRYKCHKEVWALKIKEVPPAETIEALRRYSHITGSKTVLVRFEDAGYAATTLPIEMFARYIPVKGDYYVVYDDGYKSFSPAKAFEEGYTRI